MLGIFHLKKRFFKSSVLILASSAVICFVLIVSTKAYFGRALFKEYPFDLMNLPIKKVDSIIESELGVNRDHSREAILLKVVDNSDNEFYFAILNDGPNRRYKTIYKNLPLQWSDENRFHPQWQGDSQIYSKSISEILFENNNYLELVDNQHGAMKFLVDILRNHSHIENNEFTYNQISDKNKINLPGF